MKKRISSTPREAVARRLKQIVGHEGIRGPLRVLEAVHAFYARARDDKGWTHEGRVYAYRAQEAAWRAVKAAERLFLMVQDPRYWKER